MQKKKYYLPMGKLQVYPPTMTTPASIPIDTQSQSSQEEKCQLAQRQQCASHSCTALTEAPHLYHQLRRMVQKKQYHLPMGKLVVYSLMMIMSGSFPFDIRSQSYQDVKCQLAQRQEHAYFQYPAKSQAPHLYSLLERMVWKKQSQLWRAQLWHHIAVVMMSASLDTQSQSFPERKCRLSLRQHHFSHHWTAQSQSPHIFSRMKVVVWKQWHLHVTQLQLHLEMLIIPASFPVQN